MVLCCCFAGRFGGFAVDLYLVPTAFCWLVVAFGGFFSWYLWLVGVRGICGCGLYSGVVDCGLWFLGAGWLGFWFLVPVLRHRLCELVAS